MIDIDKFLAKERRNGYTCFDFVREVWLDWFEIDIYKKMPTLKRNKIILPSELSAFERISTEEAYGFAPKTLVAIFHRKGLTPHAGIWHDRKILHLPADGVQYVPLSVASRRYNKVSFYR